MQDLGRVLIGIGLVALAAGIALVLLPRVPWLGRLPGDLRFEWDGVSVYVPLVTCLVISVVATVILNLFFRR